MRQLLRHRFATALLAFAMAAGAHAQTRNADGTVELPICNQASGKVEVEWSDDRGDKGVTSASLVVVPA